MTAALVLLWLAALGAALFFGSRWHLRARARDRLWSGEPLVTPPGDGAPAPRAEAQGWLTRWLALAGHRGPDAGLLFLSLTALGLAVGIAVAWGLVRSGLVDAGVRALDLIPGGVGQVLIPVLWAAPWLGVVVFACLPLLAVRAARRARVAATEQDLPLALDLLATLGEAGLGFDAAIDRIVDSQGGPVGPGGGRADRPLIAELRGYRAETQAGVPRVVALRGVARRLEVTPVTILMSALVQADQVGASLTESLRRQADDLRNRRRERVLVLAEALPVKLVFPLVICFLPGLFVVTLGPAFYQFFQIVDRATPRPQGR